MEAPTNLFELTLSSLGPTGHVNLLLNIKVARPQLFDRYAVYKRPPTLQAGCSTRSFFPSLHELLELSAHPIVATVHLQYQTT
jgi:hypothetical protein